MPEILAQVEQDPKAVPLTAVGYNSVVYKKIVAKAEDAPNLPTRQRMVLATPVGRKAERMQPMPVNSKE